MSLVFAKLLTERILQHIREQLALLTRSKLVSTLDPPVLTSVAILAKLAVIIRATYGGTKCHVLQGSKISEAFEF